MTWTVFNKLMAIFITVSVGWFVGRMRWLAPNAKPEAPDPSRVLSDATFFIFVPALLFRTAARIDFATLPWRTLAAYFIPTLVLMFAVYLVQRRRGLLAEGPAVPSVQSITTVFGNTLQIGVPFAAAVFGEEGLAIHITVVSLHALTLLTLLTLLVELDIARVRAAGAPSSLRQTLFVTARNTLIHPVVLPVIAGMLWNLAGFTLPRTLDEVLQLLGSAVVPVCLVVIGMSLALYGWPKRWRGVLGLISLKLLALPALVLALAHWGLGLSGMRLAVVVMMAALPTGSNALIFAQRYRTREGETTGAIVLSTICFVLTAPLWLSILGWFGPLHP